MMKWIVIGLIYDTMNKRQQKAIAALRTTGGSIQQDWNSAAWFLYCDKGRFRLCLKVKDAFDLVHKYGIIQRYSYSREFFLL